MSDRGPVKQAWTRGEEGGAPGRWVGDDGAEARSWGRRYRRLMEYFLQQLINGLTLGAIYGLIAIGYTMVYGIIGMINFAHG